ncbi:MAG: hypothetical protein K2O67_04580 [Clostridia bacterium]|nr:hypothetical protein [Clostridia bacterium]
MRYSSARNIAYIALMTALLIGGQYALGFVAGVEVVTVLLLCFSAYFGVVCGVLTAVSFSLLRCIIWGFYPAVIILYLIYYPLFALCFGLLGKIKKEQFDGAKIWLCAVVNILLAALCAACVCCAAFNVIKISALYKRTLQIFLYVLSAISAALLIAFDVLFVLTRRKVLKGGNALKLFFFTAVAAIFTACFTLLDDVISPLILGMTPLTALTYFYASFTAMLPQIVCTVATVLTLYYPVTFALTKACKKPEIY